MALKEFFLDDKGQTALEYILIIAGSILFVAITALLIRGQIISPATNSLANNASQIKNVIKNVS